MSASVKNGASLPKKQAGGQNEAKEKVKPEMSGNYKGFVAGVFSGIAKLSVG
jgi:solute carrier family 25 (mitochondrial carnitine/acylcarnitine transporter), member 20/29